MANPFRQRRERSSGDLAPAASGELASDLMLESEDLDPATASYHEAGHVLMAHLLGGRVVGASIEPDEDEWMGQTAVEWSGADAVERARRTALVALAGPVAESWWRGEASVVDALTCWREDWQEVERALLVVPASEREATLRGWLDDVRFELLNDVAWEHVCRVADMLEAHGTLDETLVEDALS